MIRKNIAPHTLLILTVSLCGPAATPETRQKKDGKGWTSLLRGDRLDG